MQPAVGLFHQAFHRRPALAASAPGRINLIGEHTDYNDGPVLPMAIARRTSVAVGPAGGWRCISLTDGTAVEVDVDEPLRGDWTDYVIGVTRALRSRDAAPPGADIAVASTVPMGAGLSSSAALTVAAAKALSLLGGRRLKRAELADVAYRAEHDEVGVKCGHMDQTISALGRAGHALLFETATGDIRDVPMPGRVGVIETGVSRRLSGGALNERRRECEEALALLRVHWPGLQALAALPLESLPEAETLLPDTFWRRVRHVVTETARTRAAAEALAGGDLVRVGQLLVEGQRSLLEDYESSVPEAELIVERALARGSYGARLTGAGWGGAVVVLAPAQREAAIMRGVAQDFLAAFGRAPVCWHTRASSGVRRERLEPV